MTDQKKSYTISCKVPVLGTVYSVQTCTTDEDEELKQCDGYCDYHNKRIIVQKHPDSWNVRKYMEKVLLHEIIHAFFYESGLAENFEHKPFGQEETIVDWIAIQMHKIQRAFGIAKSTMVEDSPDGADAEG